MKTTLVKVLWKKEKIHWKRVGEMLGKFNGIVMKATFGIIVAFLVTLAHYAFALMHTLYEIVLWVFARQTFKANLQKLAVRL